MKRIDEIFKAKSSTFSFELFPPKTDKGFDNLKVTLKDLSALNPDFISVTYGAGGGSRDKTFDIVQLIQEEHNIPSLAHLTCVLNTKDEIKNILDDTKSRGIRNVLALRGDPPIDNPDWQPTDANFKYSFELVNFIRNNYKDHFSIGVAGFPEGHLLCKDLEQDAKYLKNKLDNGANFVITQLFYDNTDYFNYLERLKKLGVSTRVIPGILPITNYKSLQKFCALGGSKITNEVKQIFEPIEDDLDATYIAGVNFAIKQCKELLEGGAPGLHFYCLNKLQPVKDILEAIRPNHHLF